MLFIEFKIQDQQKYQDFKKLYKHLVSVRESAFEFEEDDDNSVYFDWENSSLEEINVFLEESEPEVKRYKKLFPDYANAVIETYIKEDAKIAGAYGFDKKGIFNYLEFSFEVDFNNLTEIHTNLGLVEFSTFNYPFGGIERFIMTLKAFDLIPTQCFDGFTVFEFKWISKFDYEAIELKDDTKLYKSSKRNGY